MTYYTNVSKKTFIPKTIINMIHGKIKKLFQIFFTIFVMEFFNLLNHVLERPGVFIFGTAFGMGMATSNCNNDFKQPSSILSTQTKVIMTFILIFKVHFYRNLSVTSKKRIRVTLSRKRKRLTL